MSTISIVLEVSSSHTGETITSSPASTIISTRDVFSGSREAAGGNPFPDTAPVHKNELDLSKDLIGERGLPDRNKYGK